RRAGGDQQRASEDEKGGYRHWPMLRAVSPLAQDGLREARQTALVSTGLASLGRAREASAQPQMMRAAPASVDQVTGSRNTTQPRMTAQMKAVYSVGMRYWASARA